MKDEQQRAVINALLQDAARDRKVMNDALASLHQRIDELSSNPQRTSPTAQSAPRNNMRWLFIPSVAMLIALWLYIPSPFSLHDLREEKAKLTKDIAKLRQSGANADVITCEVEKEIRFCAKIDKTVRGDWDGYQIIQNK
jgi:hypothetical protein